jgi:signal transduction histidine kinase
MKFFLGGLVLSLLINPVQAQIEAEIHWFENLYLQKPVSNQKDEKSRLLQNALLTAREEHDSKAETRALIELAIFHEIQLKDYKSSLDWLIQALKLEDSTQLITEEILTFIAVARVFEEVGEFGKSLEYLNKAHFIKTESLPLLILLLSERGRIYAKIDMPNEAEQDYQEMMQYARNGELRSYEADALFLMAELYGRKKEFDQALGTHKKALAIRRETKDKVKEAISLNSVGQLYMLMKNHERAELNFSVALEICKKLESKTNLAESYNNMATFYITRRDYKSAINKLQLALQLSREAGNSDLTLAVHDNLSLCYKELGDFKNALAHREEHSGIYDVIQQEKNRADLIEVQSHHDLLEKEEEIGKLASVMVERERTIEAQRKQQNMLILILALGAIIGGLILYLYFIIHKTNRKLQEINETKDKLFSIIGHDLKAPLNSLTAFSSLLIHHAGTLTHEEIKMLSGDVDKSLKNLFALLENLLEWGRSQTGNIDFTPAPFDLGTLIKENQELLAPLAQKKNIALVNMSAESLSVHAHRHSINTVVRNLISNAIKFTPEGGQITISTEPIGSHIKVIISDNGLGINKETLKRLFRVGIKQSTLGTAQEKGTGLGLIICKDFVEKSGGTIHVDSELGKGSIFSFTVLKSNQKNVQ